MASGRLSKRLLRLLETLEDAPGSETELTCCLHPQHVLQTRELLARLRASGYCRINANGTRWALTAEGRERIQRGRR